MLQEASQSGWCTVAALGLRYAGLAASRVNPLLQALRKIQDPRRTCRSGFTREEGDAV
ncbi:hypothetical protein T1E_4522 [Pseudomonas putida DOT-T1E]|uniref:Uncharacterized protein n=1 Tax=Pseudomonas putida (strain DOT-T1E) TaxID=1196325 RepID=I7CAV7_PSEPT|nr:hypothetical protein T1E_4522 [Pseudomonas putida DOT-T1E]